MSKFYREQTYNKHQLETAWVNEIIHTHDLICGCSTPAIHAIDLLLQKSFSTEIYQKATKCLGIGEESTAGAIVHTDKDAAYIDSIDIGDLEKLFSEDADDGEDVNG